MVIAHGVSLDHRVVEVIDLAQGSQAQQAAAQVFVIACGQHAAAVAAKPRDRIDLGVRQAVAAVHGRSAVLPTVCDPLQ
jgi:hypothetical protein